MKRAKGVEGGQCLRNGVPLLENGDRMKQPEFHRRYRDYPDGVKFELVGGIVYTPSPLRYPHGTYHTKLGFVLELYVAETPGVEAADSATTILGAESEPQPDLILRIVQECGGQSKVNDEEYLEGAPELLAEVAYSSRAIDLNQKRDDYKAAGVLEYLVLSIEDRQLFWFHFPSGEMIPANRQGVYCSTVFPGLWIHGEALLARDSGRLKTVLQKGLKSKPHAAFVKRLERSRPGILVSEYSQRASARGVVAGPRGREPAPVLDPAACAAGPCRDAQTDREA